MATGGIKYLILGDGYIGNYLKEHLDKSVIFKARMSTETNELNKLIELYSPEAVINCIGKTGNPNVDWCEDNKFDTFYANTLLPYSFATTCRINQTTFINIGTGCVFESDTPLDDNAKPNFFGSFYSRTKLMTEDVLSENEYCVNLRIRLPISGTDSPKNFLSKAKKYKKITDIQNSVTYVTDLVNAIEFVVDKHMYGNINVVHPNTISIKEVVETIGRTDYEVATQEELGIGARANTILEPKKLTLAGFKFVDEKKELLKCSWEMDENE